MAAIRDAFADGAQIDELDGLTISARSDGSWFNVRPSNTEPLLRLNVESSDPRRRWWLNCAMPSSR